jgi:hypothetical protein
LGTAARIAMNYHLPSLPTQILEAVRCQQHLIEESEAAKYIRSVSAPRPITLEEILEIVITDHPWLTTKKIHVIVKHKRPQTTLKAVRVKVSEMNTGHKLMVRGKRTEREYAIARLS